MCYSVITDKSKEVRNMPVITDTRLECKRCGHKWFPRKSEVKQCPKCKSVNFDIPKYKKQIGNVCLETSVSISPTALPFK